VARTLDRASPGGPGAVLRLIRNGAATTRAQIMRETGLSRSTVAQRLDTLLHAGYITEVGTDESQGGRPAGIFELQRDGGMLLVAAIGARHVHTAVSNLACEVLATSAAHLDVGEGPHRVLGLVQDHFRSLLEELGRQPHEVRGIGIGLPGPVEFAAGRVVSPPIMTGWDGYRVAKSFGADYACPVAVDNDVNCMALGEHRANWPDQPHLLMIKAGTGVGSGLVMSGRVHRGAQGSAGDLGHTPARDREFEARHPAKAPLCRCGNRGCVEAYAGGWALVRDLREQGKNVATAEDVAELARSGDLEAVQQVRAAGRILGQAIADAVSLLNPSVVAVGGALAAAEEHLLASIRHVVYESSTPLATRDLRIVRSTLGSQAGIVGTSYMIADELFSPESVDRAVLR
jgi:predicted NBD/HSP70 family sugar kinase